MKKNRNLSASCVNKAQWKVTVIAIAASIIALL